MTEGKEFQYFAYGSNLSADRLRKSCPSAQHLGIANLPGYRLAFTRHSERWGGGVADIRPEPNSEVWGSVWCIAAEESLALDNQEGVNATPPHYHRVEVVVTTSLGNTLKCLTYQVVAPAREHIHPSKAYLDTMLRGARASGLDSNYVEQIVQASTG